MTISYDHKDKEYWMECDACSETDGPFESWEQARDAWGYSAHGTLSGEWVHRCSSCTLHDLEQTGIFR